MLFKSIHGLFSSNPEEIIKYWVTANHPAQKQHRESGVTDFHQSLGKSEFPNLNNIAMKHITIFIAHTYVNKHYL